jgi:xylulose-5-phosphate/fructose-6-phosphate phosphoketolase
MLNPNLDMDRVIAAAKAAQVHDDIVRSPMQYLSLVGDMGTTLSAGQRQRVLLARAKILAVGSCCISAACAGDVPTLETIAAVSLLREHVPELKIRVVNVVDLMTLQPKDEHPHGISDAEFDGLFTRDRPVIFAYHGYPYLIHRLTYSRKNHDNMHVRGYEEEGTTTTPFDTTVLNRLDRFHLAMDVIERVPGLGSKAAHVKQYFRDKLIEHRIYVDRHGEDMPEIQNWGWPYNTAARAGD